MPCNGNRDMRLNGKRNRAALEATLFVLRNFFFCLLYWPPTYSYQRRLIFVELSVLPKEISQYAIYKRMYTFYYYKWNCPMISDGRSYLIFISGYCTVYHLYPSKVRRLLPPLNRQSIHKICLKLDTACVTVYMRICICFKRSFTLVIPQPIT